MSADKLKKLRIFAASPSDVASERAKLETVVESLKPMADYLGLTLEVIDWREVVPDAGRPQQIIFDQLKPTSWDIFIGILWHRFGTPPGANDKTGKDYLSGTEEEFKTTYELWKQHGKPRMVIYRCTRALPFDVDPDQLKNVREFFKLIENVKGDYPALYQTFDTTKSFEKLVLNNLQKLLTEYGEESKTPITPEVEQVLAPTIPNNLPRRQAFFGRTKEMDTVMRALGPDDRTWGVLVDGIGGIGKSAIAIEAAHLSQEKNLFDAFVFVTAKTNILEPSGIKELNPPARTLDEFLNETTRILGQPGIAKLTGDEKRRHLIDVLRSMRTLLIYDNLETLSKEEQEGIADFLRELPQGCKAIITSRRRGGEGGVWLRVEKLDWDAARGIIENQISLDSSLANKLNRVGEVRWQELFDETNGSPLALVHTLGLMRVRAALTFDIALEMLRGNRDADLQKFVFQEARKELTENDKTALGVLSFFVPSATFEAWMIVAELSRNALETTIDRLSALSLVDVLIGEERYTLHPLTRTFVRNELLGDKNTTRETGMRFTRYWVDYAGQYGGESIESYNTYNLLEVEWGNLAATMTWLRETIDVRGDPIGDTFAARAVIELHRALRNFLWFSGRWDERVKLGLQRFEVSRALREWDNAGWGAFDAAFIYYNRGQTNEAAFWADQCAEIWEKGGTKREQSIGTRMRGQVARQRKNYEEAEQLLKEAVASAREYGIEEDVAAILNDLVDLALEKRDFAVADQHLREAWKIALKTNRRDYQAELAGHFGKIALSSEQWADARKWFEQALALGKEIGEVRKIADIEWNLAAVHEKERRTDLALPLATETLKIYERLQHKDLAEVREFVKKLKKEEE
jgi:tetratricopeptide (TPR) repeat protein